jgi:hypothetical protein
MRTFFFGSKISSLVTIGSLGIDGLTLYRLFSGIDADFFGLIFFHLAGIGVLSINYHKNKQTQAH